MTWLSAPVSKPPSVAMKLPPPGMLERVVPVLAPPSFGPHSFRLLGYSVAIAPLPVSAVPGVNTKL